MISEIFLAGAILLQIAAAVMAFRLIRATGRLSAWIMISIALILMAIRRIIPFARALIDANSPPADPVNEFLGLVLSGFMAAGIAMIGPIFEKIFRSERELKESERRFRSYFDLPLVGVAIVSPDDRWMTVNDRLCDMLGLSRRELAERTVRSLTFREDAERELSLDRGIEEGRAEGYSLDKRFVRKDGETLWASQAIRCVRGVDGSIAYLVLIAQDIAERKRAEEGLRRSLGEKEALLRELYHRTKNNMQMICSLLNLESSHFDDPRITEEFHLIGDRIISMSLVHEMLYVSRDLSSIDLSEYIGDLCGLLAQSYGLTSGRVSIERYLEPVRVPIDRAIPFGLILNELVTNALRHAFPGDRKGWIRIRVSKAAGDLVELVVADDGVGVAPGFDFSSASGMGLMTISALAEQLGGKAAFKRESGVECRVSFLNSTLRIGG
jgi:PAS domain S-box-containing protein